MTSLRYRLEQALWRQGVKVAVLVGEDGAQVTRFPLLLPDEVTSNDVDKALSEVSGRLSLRGLRGVWLDNGLYALEVGRKERQTIKYADVKTPEGLQVPWLLGVSSTNKVVSIDVAKAPHLLIAGETGSGKSNHVGAALANIITTKTPDEVRLALLDPKQVDLLSFADVPHTLCHVTNQDGFITTLTALCDEMTRRYSLFKRAKTRDIDAYNAQGHVMPRILCIFDEAAAAIGSNPKVLEQPVLQLLQMGRASGIHLILAMQRPNGAVLSPTARLNLPLRIAFRMLDSNSSRLVIDDASASGLLGNGDGLLLAKDGQLVRFQSPLATDKDLAKAVNIANQHPSPAWQLHGLPDEADVLTIPSDLSRYEQAILLCQHLDFIAPTDLLEHGIANSKSTAKQILSQLRDDGHIGTYDKSLKASPTNHQQDKLDKLDNQPHTTNPSLSSQLSSERTSHTQNVQNVRLKNPSARLVN